MPRHPVVKRRALFTALVVASLLLLTVFFREPATGALHTVQQGGVGALSPLQSLASRAVQPFEDGWRWVGQALRANDQNTEMRLQLEELRGQLVTLTEADQENERLKGLLDMREAGIFPQGATFVVARVIGKSPTKWESWVQIDKGSAEGIVLNQPVVGATMPVAGSLSGKGLVGKVIAVAAHAAQVQLVIDPGSSVAAVVQFTRAEGIVEGTVAGGLLMDYVERDKPVEEKRVVVTSGFGQIFPKGIPIGLVQTIGEVDVNIYKQIEVRPFVDFSSLEEVMVLTSPVLVGAGVEAMDSVIPQNTTTTAP
jgi:rod shape-determining protein MreC